MNTTKDILFETYLLNELRADKHEAFALLFKSWYADLVLYAGYYIKDKSRCEDIVQSLFIKIWEERKSLQIETSLKSYLVRAVKNSCLDEIKHNEVVRAYEEKHKLMYRDEEEETTGYILYSELADHLQSALELLPPVVREAFELNRFGGLKYKEIAQRQGVSERSVEVRISKALQLLRRHLKEYLALTLFVLKHVFPVG